MEYGIIKEGDIRMSSIEIAELTDKRHDNVLRDIDKMLEGLGIIGSSFLRSQKYESGKGVIKYRPCYYLPKRECLILVSGYSVQLRAAIIDRWAELEAKEASRAPKIPTTMVEALALALEQAKQLEAAKPKIDYHDHMVETKVGIKIGEFAKADGRTGQNRLFALLRDHGVLMKDNMPYQRVIDAGYFEVLERPIQIGRELRAVTTTLITGRGQVWLTKKLDEWL